MAGSHYFDNEPTIASNRRTLSLVLPGLAIKLESDTGVFSATRIDPGTKYLLLDGPPPPRTGAVLDLGCGYGPIAVTTAHRTVEPVWAIDINARARQLTEENAAQLGLDHVHVAEPDAVPPDLRFAQILTNPPIRMGKATLHEILQRWLPRLTDDGEAIIVIRKDLGGDSLQRWLIAHGFPTERLGSRAGYRLLRSTPQPAPPAS